MITKAEATTNAVQFAKTLLDRCLHFLEANSKAGVVGGVFTYSIEPQAWSDKLTTILNGSGWTAVNDFVAKTVTIS